MDFFGSRESSGLGFERELPARMRRDILETRSWSCCQNMAVQRGESTSGHRSSPVRYSTIRCVSTDSCKSPEMSNPDANAM